LKQLKKLREKKKKIERKKREKVGKSWERGQKEREREKA